jgi:1-phosphatidylinositol-3-phosphate 5-kinase
MSLEPVLMQEHEYLRHVAARIVALQPDIVLVHRNVSRLAQDLLRQHGITLVHNVKQTILDQLARCTEADLVTAVDAHIGRPQARLLQEVLLEEFRHRQGRLQDFDVFSRGSRWRTWEGTVLLRGGAKHELARLEKVVSFCLFATYNWRLEKSFLMDEFARPPHSTCEFLDDSKESSPTLPTVENKNDMKYSYDNVFNDDDDVFVRSVEPRVGHNNNEGKRMNSEAVQDFTDPLQSSFTELPESKETLSVAELPFSNNFRKSLDDTILCISPYPHVLGPVLGDRIWEEVQTPEVFSRLKFSSASSLPARPKLRS